ncbi:hypothetical protein WJX81_007625 [Elliptochloris bilobata]|uniref:Glycoside hydrolase family 5 domain-containing protein n=1 Tax=Elliptochloris bilobata TaxID=381761 RepID=A0AAW1S2I8_9CHLO
MEALIPEGLARRPLAEIAAQIAELGFNCVRLTYAVETVQLRAQPAGDAVTKQLSAGALAGLREHNAWVLNASVWDVFGAAVKALGAQRLMIVADNHVSVAGWCCALDDGQRWFNEPLFPVEPWLDSLQFVAGYAATQAAAAPEWRYLVGFGLRNEVLTLEFWRAVPEWYRFMGAAAAAVAGANGGALIVAGGSDSESLLAYIATQPLLPAGAPGHERLVYGAHFYDGFYVQPLWQLLGEGVTCALMTGFLDARIAVILNPDLPNTAPVWLSEVGLAVQQYDPADGGADDTRWWRCLRAWMARHDIDWGFWALQGSYYVRQGMRDYNETWGLLTNDWAGVRSAPLVSELRALQPKTLGRWDLWPDAPHGRGT